jgi:DNA-binding winged helix-turn-helix (wHTH) protein/Tol biopolymer transport system component
VRDGFVTEHKSFVFRFGDFEVREGEFALARAGETVKVEPTAFRVLLYLLRNPGRLVIKDEIMLAVWHDTAVSDNSLTRSVATLRRLLDDNSREPRYIGTVQTLGYRFLVPVEWVHEGNPPSMVTAPSPELAPLGVVASPIPQTRRRSLKAIAACAALVIAAGAILLFERSDRAAHLQWLGFGRGTAPRPLASRRLTANPEDTPLTSGVISPDGTYLAYTDSTGFYLRVVETGETHRVPLPQGFDASVEGWFPDNIHLVVSWVEVAEKPPSLWEISPMGGTPRKLADEGSSGRVSPDGSQIAFLKGLWDDNEIWLMDATGNGVRKVVDGRMVDFFGPVAWAPDGKRFAYVRASPERLKSQIEVYELASGHTDTILAEDGMGPQIAWVPPGHLVYSLPETQPNQGDANLWRIQLDSRNGRPSASPVRITNDRDGIATFSVTSDGKRIALLRCTTQADVYLAELQAQGKKLTPPRRFTLDERQDFPSSWTPDSKAVLVVSDRDGPSHIFKQSIDQAPPELFVGGKQDVWLPHITPDGKSMLYLSSAAQVGPSDPVRLMSMSLSGGPSRAVVEEPGIVNYQCARFPSTICVYGRIDPEYYRFFSFDASDGKRTELVPARQKKEAGLNNWNLSPDGQYLAMCKSQNPYDGAELRVFSLRDNTERRLPVSGVKLIMGIDWAADSMSIWVGGYMGRGSWGTRSGLVNVDLAGHVHTLLEGYSPAIMGGTPSPDGRRLAIGANTFSSNMWLAENL